MPTFLHALTLITLFSAGAFFLITVGATLLWLAEVLEQNPKDARRWGKGLIYAVSAVLGLLYLVDSYPGKQTLLSGVALLVYLRVVTSSPTPSLSAPTHSLVLAIVLLPITHFAWYWHFMHAHQADVRNRPTYGRTARVERAQEHKYDSFDRLVFYALCVWLVPFYVFLSLSSTPTKATSPSSSPSTALFPPPQDSHLASLLHRFLPRKYFRSRVDLTEGILSPRPLLRPRAPSAGPLGGGAPRSGGLNAPVEWPSSGEASSSRSPAALGRSVPMRRISSTTSLAPSHLLGASPASPTSTEPGTQSPTDLLFVRPPSSLSSQHDPSSPSGKTSFALGEAPSRKSGGGARQVPSRSATLGSDAVDRRRSIAEDV